MKNRIVKSDAEWRQELSPEQYHVMRRKGTERAFSGAYWDTKTPGVYSCGSCGAPLFSSEAKFDSGTGWPSFYAPLDEESVRNEVDRILWMRRTEVLCAACDAHLGHVFDDGPAPTGLRYCINSVSLRLEPVSGAAAAGKEENVSMETAKRTARATFAAGCFWGVEAAFRQVEGVLETSVGYTGGHQDRPTYREVCSGRTGHAEAVDVVYDPERVSYEQLLEVFWDNHNPTTRNRQGPDVGTQYRSAIFFHGPEQQAAARASMAELEKSNRYGRPIVTEIVPASEYYRAEEYHQQYLEKRGMASCHIG